MKTKPFFICLLAAICLGINLNSLDAAEPNTLSFIEKNPLFAKKSLEISEQFHKTLEDIYAPLGNGIFEPQKLCDISHLTKIKSLLKQMPNAIEKCKTAFLQQQHELLVKTADEMFSTTDDRAIFLQGVQQDDKANKWVIQYCEIQNSMWQKTEEIVDFFINNQGHCCVKNKQLLLDSADRVKKASILFQEISHLQIKVAEHINLLPKP